MMSYNYHRGKGYSPRKAGQLAAHAHGDYPALPHRSRKVANLFFFTPTFKVAMFKVAYQMLRGMTHLGIDMTKLITPPRVRGGKIQYGGINAFKTARAGRDYKSKFGVRAAITTIAVLLALDEIYKRQGFKRDQPGRRWVKEVVNEEGLVELVTVETNPMNTPLKFAYRFHDSFFNPLVDKPFGHFFSSNRNELHPLFLILQDVGMNRDRRNDETIFDWQLEGPVRSGLDVAEYMLKNGLPLIKVLSSEEGLEDPKARKLYMDDVSKWWGYTSQFFNFTYVRTPQEEKVVREMNSAYADLERIIRKYTDNETGARPTQEQINRWGERLGIRIEKLRKIIDNSPEQDERHRNINEQIMLLDYPPSITDSPLFDKIKQGPTSSHNGK